LIFVSRTVYAFVLLLDNSTALCSEELSRTHVVDFISLLAPYQAPQTRSRAKVESEQPQDNLRQGLFNLTPLESLFIDEMDDEQIWAQLDLRTQTICHMLEYVLEGAIESSNQGEETDSNEDDDASLREAINGLEEEDVDLAKYGLEEDDLDSTQDESEKESSTSGTDDEIDEEAERISPLRDVSSEETDSDKPHLSPRRTSKKRKREESSELDDGFFDLAEFNAYTERAEAKSSTKGRLAGDDSDVDEEEIDLFANVDAVDSGDDGNDGRGEKCLARQVR
jgi:U3 small nucleolar RNA-associated protein MPP10